MHPSSIHRASPARRPGAASSTRILIVDQDRQLGVTLGTMLATRRFEDIRAVRSARRAIAIAEQFRPEIVFLELNLPEGGGIAVARQLARDAHKGRPRLIALASHAADPLYDKARAAGFERLLVKPVTDEQLDMILGGSGIPK